MADEDRQPWDRRPGESSKAFKAFRFYLELDPSERTQLEAWYEYAEWNWDEEREATERNKTGGVPSYFRAWCQENDWPERATAYDEHLEREALQRSEQAHLDALEAHRDRIREFSDESYDVAEEALEQAQEMIGAIDIYDADVQEVASFLRAVTDLYKASLEAESHALGVDDLIEAVESEVLE